jgi:hypothetical protein
MMIDFIFYFFFYLLKNMSSKIYGLKYLLYKVILFKHLGQHISKRIVFSFSGILPEIMDKIEQKIEDQTLEQTLEQTEQTKQTSTQKLENSRKYLIDKIITLFEASDESLQDLKKRVINILKDY